MSNYPSQLDDDASIQRVDDNLSDIGALVINQLRAAIFAVEQELGVSLAGSAGTLADRLGVSINANGTLKSSAIIAAGAIAGPIDNDDVSPTAAIEESKLSLTYSTQSLYNDIQSLQSDVDNIIDITATLSLDFLKHLNGQNPLSTSANARHVVSHIDLNAEPTDSRDSAYSWPSGAAPRSKTGSLRGSNLAAFLHDLNDELVSHQNATGTASATADTYGHPASAISVDSDGFVVLARTIGDMQEFANAVDQASFAANANHQQNNHTNGVSRTCRGSVLSADGYGQGLVPYTSVRTYLATSGASTLVDNNTTGDDLIEFTPTPDVTYYFDSLFSQVKSGDIITVNYGSVEAQYIIDSVRFTYDGATPPNRSYIVRINGRNLADTTAAVARIDRAQFSDNKFGVLAISHANNSFGEIPSLTVSNPRGASALGIGFNADKINRKHYNLYLEFYPTGNPFDKALVLPPIDISGNLGATPGKYTLESVVEATNTAFRKEGYNYRFIAFSHKGEFGIMLADSIANASFSIISGSLDTGGAVIEDIFINNVVGDATTGAVDPLGFGVAGAGVASAQFKTAYVNINQSQGATKVFVPLKNKNYYVNGNERSNLKVISDGYTDGYGDRYWTATIASKTVVPTQTVKVRYDVLMDLRTSDLRPGKTIVVQPSLAKDNVKYNDIDYGRFIISDVTYTICDGVCTKTTIEVYNGVHASGNAVSTTTIEIPVKLYFSDDTVSFNALNLADSASSDKFKRLFEVYVDQDGHTFSHERLRYNMSTGNAQIIKLNVVKVAPKLRGYVNGSQRQINLRISSYNSTTGVYEGYLGKSSSLNVGAVSTGKKGQITRFYDETGVDFIDVIFDVNDTVATFSDVDLSLDLFVSLQLDQEVFFLGTTLYNEISNKLTYVRDGRQFGNLSENEFATSAIEFVTAGDRFTHQNGVVRGLTYKSQSITTDSMLLTFQGGLALVNGKFSEINNFVASIPVVQEYYSATAYSDVTWAVCVNAKSDIQIIPLTDYDALGSAINDPSRLITLYNPVNTQTYGIDCSTFRDIVVKRKDLTIVALVRSDVTNSTTFSCTVLDARKIIQDDSSAPILTWTSEKYSGNFDTFEALDTWLKFNSTYNSTVRVRGSLSFSSAITMNYPTLVKFVGDGATITLSGTTLFNITNNVSFDGIKFVYVPTTDGSYSTNDLVNPTNAALYCAVTNNSNIEVKNCEFTTSVAARHPFICFNYSGASSSLQNVNISNNKFSYTGAADDKRAVIAFMAPSATYTSGTTALLSNCTIDGNVCDKNQLISISAEYNVGLTSIRNAITTVGCRITNNICGAINYLTRQALPGTTYNTTTIADKDNNLIISGNNCRFIYNGLSNGLVLRDVGGTGYKVASVITTGMFSGSAMITENVISWLHLSIRTPSSTTIESPTLIIAHNKISGYNPTFLTEYYYGFTTVNTAVIVDPVTGA